MHIETIERTWLWSTVASRSLITMAGTHISIYLYSHVTHLVTATEAIGTCLILIAINRLLLLDRVGEWCVKHGCVIIAVLGICDVATDLLILVSPTLKMLLDAIWCTTSSTIVGYIVRYYKNRVWATPEMRTNFDTRRDIYIAAGSLIGGCLGYISVGSVVYPMVASIIGYLIMTTFMIVNVKQFKGFMK